MDNDNILLDSGLSRARSGSADSLSSEIIDLQDEQNCDNISIDNEKSIGRNETGSSSNFGTSPASQHLLNGQNGAKNKKLFPQKLWDLINDERYNFCLRWSEDGQLVYLNRDEFEDSYLKTAENQFHTQKAISFVRQMNMYGFRKVDDCYYENDNFKRDGEHLLKNMIRKHPNKSASNNPELTPFLYQQARIQHQVANMPPTLTNIPMNNSTLNASLLDCHQRSNLPYHDETKMPTAINQTNGNFRDQQQVAADDRLNDDSLSSVGDYCCSVGSSQGEAMGVNALDQLDSMNNDGFNANDDLRQSRQRQQQQQHSYFYPQLGSNIFDQFRSAKNIPTGILPNVTTNHFQNQLSVNPIFNSFLAENFGQNFRNTGIGDEATINTVPFYHDKVGSGVGNYMNQHHVQNKASNHQESNINFNGSPVNADFNNSDMSAIYALISSIGANFYQSPSLPHQNVDQSLTCERLSSLQQLYQQIMLSSGHLSSAPSSLIDHSNGGKSQSKEREPTEAAVNYSQSFEKPSDASPKSLLFKNRPSTSPSKLGSKLNETLASAETSNKSAITGRDLTIKCRTGSSSPILQRRETKSNRSFKRSVDSILDSNNNPNATKEREALIKRLKLQSNYNGELDVEKVVTTSYARGLVTRIALTRDSNIDEDVLDEASKYTERFVETLLDTAQVIARHSYGSSSSSSDPIYNHDNVGIGPIDETGASNDKEEERSLINTSDLTSALKLLPSKLLKILK